MFVVIIISKREAQKTLLKGLQSLMPTLSKPTKLQNISSFEFVYDCTHYIVQICLKLAWKGPQSKVCLRPICFYTNIAVPRGP